jgi:transposase-like protein
MNLSTINVHLFFKRTPIMDNLSPASQPHLRQSYTAAQKIKIVQESMLPDVSIASVAMAHRINANQLHRWRWMYRNDKLGSRADRLEFGSVAGFLPVKLTSSVLAPKPRAAVVVNKPVISSPSLPDSVHAPIQSTVQSNGHIELFVGKHRVCLYGEVQPNNLLTVLTALNSTTQTASNALAPNAVASNP